MEHVLTYLQRPTPFHSTLRDVVDDLQARLQGKGIEIPDSFVLLMIKLVSLEPSNKFLIKQALGRQEVERLKKLVVSQIGDMSEATRDVIRIQLHFKSNSFTRKEVADARRHWLEDQIQDPMLYMTKRIPKHERHYDFYYEKLISAMILWSEMGSLTNDRVLKETEAALLSIFPKDDISLLMPLTPDERAVELRQVMKMTAGIRLYNRDLSPGEAGAGIPDLSKLLAKKLTANAQLLDEVRRRNLQRLISYTNVTKPYFLDETATTNTYGRREFEQEMIGVHHGLIMVHQLLICLKNLAEELNNEEKISKDLLSLFESCLTDLRDTMQKEDQVATFTIYPKFIALAAAWEKLQDSLLYVESLEALLNTLIEYSEKDLSEIDARIPGRAAVAADDAEFSGGGDGYSHGYGEEDGGTDRPGLPGEEEFFTFPEFDMVDDPQAAAQRVPVSQLKDFDPMNAQYAGFCVYALVKGYGLLLLSNPNIGVYNWKGHQYLFSSPEGATEFARDPDNFIYKAIHVARRWPQLIHLLKMEHVVFNPEMVQAADRHTSAGKFDAKISTEMSIQTELHPLESNIVPGYTWNEWELRKQALILSNIHKCATHSTQTHWQALKKTQQIQTYSARNRRLQTDQNKYIEAPRNQFYFFGLCGLHHAPPHIVELTREPVMELRCLARAEEMQTKPSETEAEAGETSGGADQFEAGEEFGGEYEEPGEARSRARFEEEYGEGFGEEESKEALGLGPELDEESLAWLGLEDEASLISAASAEAQIAQSESEAGLEDEVQQSQQRDTVQA